LQDAESKAAVARSDFQRVQYAAVTEIVTARNGLRTALQSYHAATALVDASQITYNAALAAYNKGMGTIDAATTADTALLNARQSQIDARAAVLISAIKLAFVLGKLTSNHDAAQ
jgi:outer membrane protein TolC